MGKKGERVLFETRKVEHTATSVNRKTDLWEQERRVDRLKMTDKYGTISTVDVV